MPYHLHPNAINQSSHQDRDQDQNDTELCHGVGRNYYYFEDDKRTAIRFSKKHVSWKHGFCKNPFRKKRSPIQAPPPSPIDPSINGEWDSKDFELFADTYVEFMGKHIESDTEDSNNLRKKKSATDRKQDEKEKTKFSKVI